MKFPTVIMTTWQYGLFAVSGDSLRQELAGRSASGLLSDGLGGALAIVDGRTLCRRSPEGEWRSLATTQVDLACCLLAGDGVYVGTNDARILSLDAAGQLQPLTGFDSVAGRDQWYAGAALVDGKLRGPPLGIRSMTVTCDGAALLANVHVGGIPRSTDGGATWQPTIDIQVDVHQVCAHPTRPEVVAAAAGAGLCISRDAGATWTVETAGLHAPHCTAVAFSGEDVWVSASADQFSSEGAVYRRPLDGAGPLEPLASGLPRWLSGICDTGCITVRGTHAVIADRAGNLYRSTNAGRTWACLATGHGTPTGVAIL
jgi:photosystem II stability/assembly factor-like uncharacterized protein